MTVWRLSLCGRRAPLTSRQADAFFGVGFRTRRTQRAALLDNPALEDVRHLAARFTDLAQPLANPHARDMAIEGVMQDFGHMHAEGVPLPTILPTPVDPQKVLGTRTAIGLPFDVVDPPLIAEARLLGGGRQIFVGFHPEDVYRSFARNPGKLQANVILFYDTQGNPVIAKLTRPVTLRAITHEDSHLGEVSRHLLNMDQIDKLLDDKFETAVQLAKRGVPTTMFYWMLWATNQRPLYSATAGKPSFLEDWSLSSEPFGRVSHRAVVIKPRSSCGGEGVAILPRNTERARRLAEHIVKASLKAAPEDVMIEPRVHIPERYKLKRDGKRYDWNLRVFVVRGRDGKFHVPGILVRYGTGVVNISLGARTMTFEKLMDELNLPQTNRADWRKEVHRIARKVGAAVAEMAKEEKMDDPVQFMGIDLIYDGVGFHVMETNGADSGGFLELARDLPPRERRAFLRAVFWKPLDALHSKWPNGNTRKAKNHELTAVAKGILKGSMDLDTFLDVIEDYDFEPELSRSLLQILEHYRNATHKEPEPALYFTLGFHALLAGNFRKSRKIIARIVQLWEITLRGPENANQSREMIRVEYVILLCAQMIFKRSGEDVRARQTRQYARLYESKFGRFIVASNENRRNLLWWHILHLSKFIRRVTSDYSPYSELPARIRGRVDKAVTAMYSLQQSYLAMCKKVSEKGYIERKIEFLRTRAFHEEYRGRVSRAVVYMEEAIALFREVLKKPIGVDDAATYADRLFELASLYKQQGRPEKVFELLRDFPYVTLMNHQYHYLLAWSLEQLDHPRSAKRHYARASHLLRGAEKTEIFS